MSVFRYPNECGKQYREGKEWERLLDSDSDFLWGGTGEISELTVNFFF